MIFFVDGLLWAIALVLGLIAASRSRHLLYDSLREGVIDCLRLIQIGRASCRERV